MENEIPDLIHIIDLIKGVYDWRVLAGILQGEEYISNAKIKQFLEMPAKQIMLRMLSAKTSILLQNIMTAYVINDNENGRAIRQRDRKSVV